MSKKLAIGTRFLAASLGAASGVYFFKRPETSIIEGRTVSQRDTWTARWTPGSSTNRLVERDAGMQWGAVREVRDGQALAQVWNLEVEEDNSYVADGVVVHNCQEYSYMAMPWSKAKAKAAAIRADDTGKALADLNRLFNACFRIQREACEAAGRHIPLVVENVRGAIPWVGRSRWNFGSFHLWGDVPALMPVVSPRAILKPQPYQRRHGTGSWFAIDMKSARAGITEPEKISGPNLDGQVPGFRFDGSGRSFQTASVETTGRKSQAMNWSDRTKRGQDFTRVAGRQIAEGRKGAGAGAEWFDSNLCQLPSKSSGRKMASAMIAKIPLPLSRHIAATYRAEGVAA